MGVGSRTSQPGEFLLEIGGTSAGYVRNFEGGGAQADVIREQVGAFTRKHIGDVRFEDIVLDCDAGAGKPLWDWVGQTSRGSAPRKDGAVIVSKGDASNARLEWNNGLVEGIYVPALDSMSTDALHVTVKIRPELTRHKPGGSTSPATVAKKGVSTGTFRLVIDGLEDACRHVTHIEPIAIEQKVKAVPVGARMREEYEPVSLEPGNLVVTLGESSAKVFYDWFDSFVIKGNSAHAEKRGSLEAGPFTLAFSNLGIFGITNRSKDGQSARDIRVEMYCDSIDFSAKTAG
jgi:hypothetical protein